MRMRTSRFGPAETGTTSVEFGLTISIFMLVLLAVAEFALAYWQWNAAAKAAQLGARFAAVSDPVDRSLKAMSGLGSAQPGDPMPFFEVTCRGDSGTCNGNSSRYDASAMAAIVFGSGNTACPAGPQPYPPMCQVLGRVAPENIVISYTQTGLGFAGRPDGPVPTITLRLEDLRYDFIVLDRLIGSGTIMPNFITTVTGESLSSSAL